jgi:hypothetical protein
MDPRALELTALVGSDVGGRRVQGQPARRVWLCGIICSNENVVASPGITRSAGGVSSKMDGRVKGTLFG